MTDDQVKEYLKSRGLPEWIWRGGSAPLIQRWKDFVAKIEKPEYTRNWLIDDYWAFLSRREWIHNIAYDDYVAEADERFRGMLMATNIKHWHKDRDTDYDFWNYGYPKNARGFFLEQLECHILDSSENLAKPDHS
jgi:hypothetical protein